MENCPLCGNLYGGHEGVFVDEEFNGVIIDGESVKLTRRLTQTLAGIVRNSPRVITKAHLMDYIYGLETEDEPGSKVLDTFICMLRKRIKHTRFRIETIQGSGYRLKEIERGGQDEGN